MRSCNVMRYYHPFPEAIPLSEAGCSRVTHPSATMLLEQAPITPFDLHVLGVPPAFVLSQDQTLHRVVSPSDFTHFEIWFIANRSQLLLCFIVLSDFSYWFIESTRVPVFLAFSFLALFSFQDAVRFPEVFILVKRLIYYTTFSEICQAFFQTFSSFFWTSFR